MSNLWTTLKNLPIPIVALLLGAALFLLGIQDSPITIKNVNIQLTQSWEKILSIIIGSLVLFGGFVLAVMLKRIEMQSNTPAIVPAKSKKTPKQLIEAQDFFTTLMDKPESFEEMVQGATQLYVLSITSVNLSTHAKLS
jgi:hypothetical protein